MTNRIKYHFIASNVLCWEGYLEIKILWHSSNDDWKDYAVFQGIVRQPTVYIPFKCPFVLIVQNFRYNDMKNKKSRLLFKSHWLCNSLSYHYLAYSETACTVCVAFVNCDLKSNCNGLRANKYWYQVLQLQALDINLLTRQSNCFTFIFSRLVSCW